LTHLETHLETLHDLGVISESDAAHFVAKSSYTRCIQAGDTEAE
jgi:hypothetical protein